MLESLRLTTFLAMAMLGATAFAQATPTGIDPNYPTSISNSNIWKIYTDYQMMIEEMDKSITRGNAGLLSHDATRWRSYIAALRAETAYWQSQAFLDMPVTHGRKWEIGGPLEPGCPFKSNTAACLLMSLVVTARDELVLSSSAVLPMHLNPDDLARQESFWTAMEGYITFMEQNSPLDEPVTAAEANLGLEPGFDKE